MNLLLYDCVASLAASINSSGAISSISASERKGEDEGGYFLVEFQKSDWR